MSATPELQPAAGPNWRAALERAQARLGRAAFLLAWEREPVIDASGAARALERALGAAYDAIDHRDEPLSALRRAADEADRARAELATGAAAPLARACMQALEQARAELGQAEQLLASRPPPPRPDRAPEIMASGTLPRLHALDRPSLAPTIAVTPPPRHEEPALEEAPTRPRSFEELHARMAELRERAATHRTKAVEAAPAPEGFAPEVPAAASELDLIRERTRELVEEVAMVGVQRAPLLGDPWRSATWLEQRMFRAIDAIVSMGPRALGCLEELALDAPVKDAPRLFALAMVLGCVRGRDALAAVERVFVDYELADAASREALGEALKLVPHDELPIAMRTMLAGSDARHRALAIDVLGYRGLASEAELTNAASDEPLVAAVALPHLALTRSRACAELCDAALESAEPALRRAGWIAGALAAHPRITARLRDALDDEEACWLLSIAGDEHDAAHLLEQMRGAPTPALVNAVGWAGAADAVPALLQLLDGEDDRLVLAAAYALERLTGAELREETEVETEEILVADPPEPDVGEPPPLRLALAVSDPRDRPPEPALETVPQPTIHAPRWQAWLREHPLPAARRIRRGRPYTPGVSLWELDAGPCTPAERRMLGRELVIRTGAVVRFDTHDFVPVQEEALGAWEPHARRASSQAGIWHRPLPR